MSFQSQPLQTQKLLECIQFSFSTRMGNEAANTLGNTAWPLIQVWETQKLWNIPGKPRPLTRMSFLAQFLFCERPRLRSLLSLCPRRGEKIFGLNWETIHMKQWWLSRKQFLGFSELLNSGLMIPSKDYKQN